MLILNYLILYVKIFLETILSIEQGFKYKCKIDFVQKRNLFKEGKKSLKWH